MNDILVVVLVAIPAALAVGMAAIQQAEIKYLKDFIVEEQKKREVILEWLATNLGEFGTFSKENNVIKFRRK